MNKKLLTVIVCVLILVPAVLPTTSLAAPPANDDFDSAVVILELPFTDNLDTTEATWAEDDPGDCTSNGSVWYAFTPGTNMRIEANTYGSDYDTVLSVYTGSRGALSIVPGACNDDFDGLQSRVRFDAIGGTTYYFLIGFCCGTGGNGGGNLVFSVQELEVPPPPANDNFSDALAIDALPFNHTVDTTGASIEAGEPSSSCVSPGELAATAWYVFTPAEGVTVSANASAPFATMVAVYTGSSLADLIEVGCRTWGLLTFHADAGNSYYLQVGSLYGERGPVWFNLDFAPLPEADFNFYPDDPSTFDTVQFSDWSWDPADVGIASQAWDFGDGASATGCCPTHRYASDGDYSVQLAITTFDGRTGSTSRSVRVATHDVAITRVGAPQAAKSGQTRQIVVEINSKRYPERVEVQLFKSVPGGFEFFGSLTQQVPVRPSNRTTRFKFSYTFTGDDASIGKVSFKAIANLVDARDALPADNEAIAPPTKVNR